MLVNAIVSRIGCVGAYRVMAAIVRARNPTTTKFPLDGCEPLTRRRLNRSQETLPSHVPKAYDTTALRPALDGFLGAPRRLGRSRYPMKSRSQAPLGPNIGEMCLLD